MWNNRRIKMPTLTVTVILIILGCLLLSVEGLNLELSPSTAARSARLMRFLTDPATINRRANAPGQFARVRPSVENVHPPAGWRPPPGPQLIRREFNNNFPNGGRFAHAKDAAVLDIGKSQFYRPKEIQQYNHQPNQYTQNFKASPHFNGVAIKSEVNKFPNYAPIQQHAIPVEANKYLAYKQGQVQGQGQGQGHGQGHSQGLGLSQGQVQSFGQAAAYADVATKQALQYNQFGQAQNSYAVYEDAENAAKAAANFGQNYQQSQPAVPPKLTKAAEEYLHFMSTNEYFLPRHEPNYKQLDVERDQIKYQHQQQKLIQKEPQAQPQLHHLPDTSASSSYNKPLRAADLFYQQDPAPGNLAVVRGSYQAGQNSFVVKSDGNKSVKHILSTSLASKPTQPQPAPQPKAQTPPVTYSHVWHKTEKPEPLRFEFTEHDAIKGSASYTNAPQGQKFYYETHPSTPHIPTVSAAPIIENVKPVQEVPVIAKDNNEYANKNAEVQSNPQPAVTPDPAELESDKEAYCEKICANVYDENDEIVCGSDGYMYTGESQLECYSSCLNIEVSIKSKGSCS
ncbi:uncharacterized protein LOC133845755 [Drosophila sulfurigaster albostrigata]|uniref:uncharacterized protein LOC133845755 n=1 Tax=Drosophila sulfurigaster albostrigata TaxID=89887 RepID=UPI002D21C63B|nr:uncharacterized protein LOC133845755 [Drosophila sulfurigaster albostrigata]